MTVCSSPVVLVGRLRFPVGFSSFFYGLQSTLVLLPFLLTLVPSDRNFSSTFPGRSGWSLLELTEESIHKRPDPNVSLLDSRTWSRSKSLGRDEGEGRDVRDRSFPVSRGRMSFVCGVMPLNQGRFHLYR